MNIYRSLFIKRFLQTKKYNAFAIQSMIKTDNMQYMPYKNTSLSYILKKTPMHKLLRLLSSLGIISGIALLIYFSNKEVEPIFDYAKINERYYRLNDAVS